MQTLQEAFRASSKSVQKNQRNLSLLWVKLILAVVVPALLLTSAVFAQGTGGTAPVTSAVAQNP